MNPHAGLPFEESARIIINHVKDGGVKIAQKYNVPQQIIDFIETHHGTSMPKYFISHGKMPTPPGKRPMKPIFYIPGRILFPKRQQL